MTILSQSRLHKLQVITDIDTPSPHQRLSYPSRLGSTDSTLSVVGPVTMTGNTALYQGGVIFNKGNVTLPQEADVSGNSAATCPSIKNWEEWESSYVLDTYRSRPDGSVEFAGGSTYSGSSSEICYFGEDTGSSESALVLTPETAECGELFGAGTTLGGYSYITLDTRVASTVQFEVGAGDFEISCAKQSVSGDDDEPGTVIVIVLGPLYPRPS